MKFLFIALLLSTFLIGCDDDPPTIIRVKQEDLGFKANDFVLIHQPFYENCFGVVVGYDELRPSNKPQNYKVSVICKLGPLGKIIDASETDLQLRLRSELNIEEPSQDQ